MRKQTYKSDLTDREWDGIKDLIPPAMQGGRPRSVDMRAVLNGIFYILRGGGAWSLLPNDLPPRGTVYDYFRRFCLDGTIERMHDRLRELVRQQDGRMAEPTAAILDSQSVKTTEVGGPERGFDGGKKVRGRKRHILVDTNGLLLDVKVHAANTQDRKGARAVLAGLAARFLSLVLIWVDGGYRSAPLQRWMNQLRPEHPITLEVVKRSDDQKGFAVLPRRWVVERTFAWIGRHRRLSKDYERLPRTSEAMIRLAMIRLMLKRLAAA
jgi:putative transposase